MSDVSKPYPNYHAARMRDPDDFKRIRVLETTDAGVMIYGGPLKDAEDNNTTVQAYRFPSEKYDVAEAKAWLKEHDADNWKLFEPAENSKKVGPGGHKPDKSGPYGAGAGPGRGRKDGSGLLSKIESIEDKEILSRIESIIQETESGVMKIKMQVLEKLDANTGFTYNLGYAVNGIKPRIGDNIRYAGESAETDIEAEVDDIVYCKTDEIKPEKDGQNWIITFNGLTIIEKSENAKPESTTEILRKAYKHDAIVAEEGIVKQLQTDRYLKNIFGAKSHEVDINKTFDIIKDDAKQIVYGVVYEPFNGRDVDAHGDYATEKEIEKAAHLFLEKYNKVSLMHEMLIDNRAKVVESYIAPQDFKINGQTIKKGSWVMAVHVIDNNLWADVKSKKLNAFSIEGKGKSGPNLLRKSLGGNKMKIKKQNLIDMVINAVALVDRGANKKTFFLLKRDKGENMNITEALKWIEENAPAELASVVVDAIRSSKKDGVKKSENGEDIDVDALIETAFEKAGAKYSKATMDQLKKINETINSLKALVENMAPKQSDADVKKQEEEKEKEEIKKYLDNPELDVPEKLLPKVIAALAEKE